MSGSTPSAEFPFEARYADVYGSRLHYVDEGSGEPVLFLHGNPTWSYLWRNVIPHLTPRHRCIAPDLPGFGRSDKPAIEYRVFDHCRYVEALIDTLALGEVTLVLHDWGSAIGLDYARRHPHRVRAIVLMEAMLAPMPGLDFFPPPLAELFRQFRTPGVGEQLVCEQNVFVEKVLPGAVARGLTEAEMACYREPFPTPESRRPVHRFPNELSFAGEPADVTWMIERYRDWLCQAPQPKLLFHVDPGVLVPAETVRWARAHLPALTTVALGPGLHYVQEDYPDAIGAGIAEWLPAVAA